MQQSTSPSMAPSRPAQAAQGQGAADSQPGPISRVRGERTRKGTPATSVVIYEVETDRTRAMSYPARINLLRAFYLDTIADDNDPETEEDMLSEFDRWMEGVFKTLAEGAARLGRGR